MTSQIAIAAGKGWSSDFDVDPLLADREVAALLDCGRSTVWRWSAEGTIPKPMKIGGMSRWRQSEIEAVIQRAAAEHEAA